MACPNKKPSAHPAIISKGKCQPPVILQKPINNEIDMNQSRFCRNQFPNRIAIDIVLKA